MPRNGPGVRDPGAPAAEAGTPSPETRLAAAGMSWLAHRRQKSVVVGPTTTNAARGRTSRQAHLAQKSQQPQPPAGGILDDHGISGGGACNAKSETAATAPPSLIMKIFQVYDLRSL